MTALSLGALSIALAWAVLRDGAVETPDWAISLLIVALVGVLLCVRPSPDFARQVGGAKLWLPVVLLLWVGLQAVPLPFALVRLLAPERAAVLEAGDPTLGQVRWAALSATPGATREKLIGLLGCVVVFWLAAELARRLEDRPWAPVWPFVALGVFQGALGLVQAYAPGVEGLATGTYVNRNHYAGFLELCLPLTLFNGVAVLQTGRSRHGLSARSALAAGLLFTAAAIMLLGILHSLSRMGFVAALGGLFVAGMAATGGVGAPAWRRRAGPAAIGLVLLLAFVFLPPDKLIYRFGDMASTEEISADTRIQIWRDTLALIRAQPVTGCGLGAYESALMPHKLAAPLHTVDFAHNDYLQLAAELGLPAMAVLLWLAGYVLRSAWRTARADLPPDERARALGCLGGLAALALHSLVDFNLYIPANAMAAAWVAGLAVASGVGFRQHGPAIIA